MNRQTFLTIIVAMLASAALLPVPSMAADAYGTHAANQPAPDRQKPRTAKRARQEKQAQRQAQRQVQRQTRRERDKVRRIAAYTLFRDPQFKLEGAIADKRSFDLLARTPAANAARPMQDAPPARTPGTGIPRSAFKAAEPDNTIGFNCHEKILNPSIANRETSACYQSGMDKTWKAQTYVSRQRTEGNWGGGFAFGIAY